MKVKLQQPKLIGRRERISFPELSLFGIEAKIDTGAYTTAIHCHDIILKEINGKDVLCFKLLDPEHPEYADKELRFENYKLKTFKNSFGEQESRYVVQTLIKLGNRKIRGAVSLTSRAGMRYPVLLGRKILKGRFHVDVSAEYLLKS
jgi:hypothetical protein